MFSFFYRYEPYFSSTDRREGVREAADFLIKKASKPVNFVKQPNGRYDAEISQRWKMLMQFTACTLAFNYKRGGIACYMQRSEAARAKPARGSDGRMVINVKEHKTMKTHGAAAVVLSKDDMLIG